jgi:uncharacterized protein (DUF486 family)
MRFDQAAGRDRDLSLFLPLTGAPVLEKSQRGCRTSKKDAAMGPLGFAGFLQSIQIAADRRFAHVQGGPQIGNRYKALRPNQFQQLGPPLFGRYRTAHRRPAWNLGLRPLSHLDATENRLRGEIDRWKSFANMIEYYHACGRIQSQRQARIACFAQVFSFGGIVRFYLTAFALLVCSNIFMTFAWYGHLKNLAAKPLIVAIMASWGIAFFEYVLQVPANRMGHQVMTVGQLKILQELITLSVFVPFSFWYMNEKLTLDYLWAGLCLLGAAFFIFRRSLFAV